MYVYTGIPHPGTIEKRIGIPNISVPQYLFLAVEKNGLPTKYEFKIGEKNLCKLA